MKFKVNVHTKCGKGGIKYFESKEMAHTWINKHRNKLKTAEITEGLFGSEVGLGVDAYKHSMPPKGSIRQFSQYMQSKMGISPDALEQYLSYGIDDDEDRERIEMLIQNGDFAGAKDEMMHLGLFNESRTHYKFSRIFGFRDIKLD